MSINEDFCKHSNTVYDDKLGEKICCDCLEALGPILATFYDYTRYNGCRRQIENLGPVTQVLKKRSSRIPVNVIYEADEIYLEITKGAVHRQDPRKSLIYFCLIKAYTKLEIDVDEDEILDILNITNEKVKKGIMLLENKYGYDLSFKDLT